MVLQLGTRGLRSEAALIGITLAVIGATVALMGYGMQATAVPAEGPSKHFYLPIYYLALLTQYGGGIVVAFGATLTTYGAVSRDKRVVN